MSKSSDPRPDQEGFGEANLGETQSENPPPDPEMIDGEGDGRAEEAGGEGDSGPSGTPEQINVDEPRDQAEG